MSSELTPMSHLVPTIDGHPISAQSTNNNAIAMLGLMALMPRLSFARRRADGTLEPVPLDQVEIAWSSLAHWYGASGDIDGWKRLVGELATILAPLPPRRASDRELGAAAQRVNDLGADLARQESEARDRLLEIRGRRERVAQLEAAGDRAGAAEAARGIGR